MPTEKKKKEEAPKLRKGFIIKQVKVPLEMHDNFLKIAHKHQHDFMKRVRFLIQKDIDDNGHLLIKQNIKNV